MTEEEYNTVKKWFIISNKDKAMIVCDTPANVNARKHLDWTSEYGYFETEEELRREAGIPEKPCIECGNVFETNYVEPVKIRLISRNICFSCLHWLDKIEIKDRLTTVRAGHIHYQISPDDPTAYFKGFGGAEFKIRFNDGREVITHNLWCQGEIPERFWDKLPDNAIFVNVL